MASRLTTVKDPVTTLTGFALFAEQVPSARLHIFPASDDLLSVCRGLTDAIPALGGRVTVHAKAAAGEMADVLSAADYLLQSSIREWSGLVVLEAMACGAIPIVTDLAPFRRMTDGGRAGRLFAVGDAAGLAAAMVSAEREGRESVRVAVLRRFATALSFDALAADLIVQYEAAQSAGSRARAA
jgi:glycosyltransferase involved in cell wall biosynthesis